MNIFVISEIKEELVSEIDLYEKVTLNLSQVEDFDTSGMQILVAFQKELTEKKQTLEIISPSTAVMNVLKLYQITNFFNIQPTA